MAVGRVASLGVVALVLLVLGSEAAAAHGSEVRAYVQGIGTAVPVGPPLPTSSTSYAGQVSTAELLGCEGRCTVRVPSPPLRSPLPRDASLHPAAPLAPLATPAKGAVDSAVDAAPSAPAAATHRTCSSFHNLRLVVCEYPLRPPSREHVAGPVGTNNLGGAQLEALGRRLGPLDPSSVGPTDDIGYFSGPEIVPDDEDPVTLGDAFDGTFGLAWALIDGAHVDPSVPVPWVSFDVEVPSGEGITIEYSFTAAPAEVGWSLGAGAGADAGTPSSTLAALTQNAVGMAGESAERRATPSDGATRALLGPAGAASGILLPGVRGFPGASTPLRPQADAVALTPAPLSSGPFLAILAVSGALLAVPPLLALYRRVLAARALENPERRRIYDEIVRRPGVNPGDLRAATGLHYTTCEHHVRILADLGLIQTLRLGVHLRLYENHGRYGATETRVLAAMRHATTRAVLTHILRNPHVRPAEVARAVGLSRPAAKHHVDRLVSLGLVEAGRDGTAVRLSIAPKAVDPLIAALGP
ncbi:MAG: winged helix-turn-helix transcriptional regulator [Methanobacteriota archaeon]